MCVRDQLTWLLHSSATFIGGHVDFREDTRHLLGLGNSEHFQAPIIIKGNILWEQSCFIIGYRKPIHRCVVVHIWWKPDTLMKVEVNCVPKFPVCSASPLSSGLSKANTATRGLVHAIIKFLLSNLLLAAMKRAVVALESNLKNSTLVLNKSKHTQREDVSVSTISFCSL